MVHLSRDTDTGSYSTSIQGRLRRYRQQQQESKHDGRVPTFGRGKEESE